MTIAIARLRALACAAAALLLGACRQPATDVPVRHANYSDAPFRYQVIGAARSASAAAPVLAEAYGSGPSFCCARVPVAWRTDSVLRLETLTWLEDTDGAPGRVVRQVHALALPRYDRPAPLWVVREADGALRLVASAHGPGDPGWPGGRKGLPQVPLAHVREQWQREVWQAEEDVRAMAAAIDELNRAPEFHLPQAWAEARHRLPRDLAAFSGPTDPLYRAALPELYRFRLLESRTRLAWLKKHRP